jgi:hypothetical protein
MSEKKSNLPDLNEITSMAGKLFKDVKNSVGEIIDTYKKNRAEAASTASNAAVKETPEKSTKKDGE